jgi:polar amino acid transport system permease protein
LGLGYVSRLADVILPQAFRIALPALVGFSVMMVKATSLTSVLGLVEITKAAQSINSVTLQPLIIFGTVAAAYFAVCWPLSLLIWNTGSSTDDRLCPSAIPGPVRPVACAQCPRHP